MDTGESTREAIGRNERLFDLMKPALDGLQ